MIKIVFSDSGSLFASAIKLLTWSDFAHVAVLTNEDKVIDSRFDNGGVTEYSFAKLQRESKRLTIREFPNLSEDVIAAMRTQLHRPYDVTAILGIPFRRNWQEDDSWFCSELVAWAAVQAGTSLVNKETWRITPQDLFQASIL